MKHEPLVQYQPGTTHTARTFRNDTGAEAPWSPVVESYGEYYPYYGSLEDSPELGRYEWKPVTHYVRKQVPGTKLISGAQSKVSTGTTPYWVWGPSSINYWWSSGDLHSLNGKYHFGDLRLPLNGLPQFFDTSSQVALWQSQPADVDGLVAHGISTMAPGIRASASVLNSLWELKDFKSLPRRILRIKDAITNSPIKGVGGKYRYLKDIAKAVASGFLEGEFNLKPLAQDIVDSIYAIREARHQLSELERAANRRLKSHYVTYLSAQYPDSSDLHSYPSLPSWLLWPTQIKCERRVRYPVRRLNVTMEYSYKLPPAGLLGNELSALLDVLGVNVNPAIIWNALPWSFVVDWVFSVGKYLDNFKVRNIEPVLFIHRCCYSVKLERHVNAFLHLNGTQHPTFAVYESSYIRRLVNPNVVNASLRTSGLNPKELGLLTALGVTRL